MSIVLSRNSSDLVSSTLVSGAVTQAVILADRSDSTSPFIEQVNKGLGQTRGELAADEIAADSVDVTVISYGGDVRIDAGPVIARNLPELHLTAGGNTPAGEAVHRALDLIETEQHRYAHEGTRVKVPWMFGYTDGCFTDEWRSAASRVRDLAARGKLNFFMAYFGNADVAQLSELCPPDQPPLPLDQTKFANYFAWFSASLIGASRNQGGPGPTPPTTTWVAR
jgi:uncharacterized protein YegL